jgi:hypothetical protein
MCYHTHVSAYLEDIDNIHDEISYSCEISERGRDADGDIGLEKTATQKSRAHAGQL